MFNLHVQYNDHFRRVNHLRVTVAIASECLFSSLSRRYTCVLKRRSASHVTRMVLYSFQLPQMLFSCILRLICAHSISEVWLEPKCYLKVSENTVQGHRTFTTCLIRPVMSRVEWHNTGFHSRLLSYHFDRMPWRV